MVRFKNRWLLVEFLQPDQHYAPPLSGPGSSQDEPIQPHPGHLVLESDDPDSELDDFITTSSSVTLPFLAPMQPIFLTPQARQYYQASKSSNSKGKEPAAGPPGTAIPEKQIYHALKKSIIQVFGDAGWGKVGNSLAVKYFSQTTSLCIIRVARDHVRTAWGGLTYLTQLDGTRVLPRVIGCSGTLKKLYEKATTHTTLLTAHYLSHALQNLPPPSATSITTVTSADQPPSRHDKVVQAESQAWRDRRDQVLEGLRAVEEAR